MVRFASADDDNFQLVLKEIKAILNPPQMASSDPKLRANPRAEPLAQHAQDPYHRHYQQGQESRKNPKACDVGGAIRWSFSGSRTGTILTFASVEFLSRVKDYWSMPELALELECVAAPCKGTCKWIYEAPTYRSWSDSSDSGTFLLTGKMGSGKTVLARSTWAAIQSQGAYPSKDNKLHLAYFCSRVRRKSENTDLLLWTLICQVLEACPSLFSSVDGLQEVTKVFNWPLEEVWTLLWDLIRHSEFESVFILIDALDECEYNSVDEFLESYTEFCLDKFPVGKTVKFFITMRHDDGPVDGFVESDSLWRLHIRPADVLPDIKNTMERPIQRIVAANKWDEDQASRLTAAIADRADGMFQWVNIAMDGIARGRRRPRTHKELLGEINNIPKKLEQLYSRELRELIKDMDSIDLDQIKSLLAWVLLASRPLTVPEMIMALSIEDGMLALPTKDEQRTSAPASLSPFVEISTSSRVEAGGETQVDANDSQLIVRPIHESVRQFLWDVCMKPESRKAWPELFIGEAQGHALIAKTCITYIRCSEISVGWVGEKKFSDVGQILPTEQMTSSISDFLQRHELLRYVADDALFYHIRQSVRDPPGDVFDYMVDTLIDCPSSIATFTQARQYVDKVGTEWHYWNPGPALHMCARVDSLELLRRFAERVPSIDWNERDDTGSTVLFDSLAHGPPADAPGAQLELVQYLIGRGSDPRIVDRLGHTPAYWAVFMSHTAVLQELLGRGISLSNREKIYGETLLHTAAFETEPECARALIEAGHEINVRDNDGKTPLMTAAHNGSLEIVKLLLSHGADVRLVSKHKMTALSFCAIDGSCEVGRLLIDHHCPILAKDNWGSSALHLAARFGHVNLMKQLLDAGADIGARDATLLTPLGDAALADKAEAVRLLAQVGADVNVRDKEGCTPLFLAASNRCRLVVEALVSLGADPTIKDGSPNSITPVHVAILNGDSESVEHLMKSQFEVLTVQDALNLQQPVHYAAIVGSVHILNLLLRRGVDITTADTNGHTAVQIAAGSEHVEFLRYALEQATACGDPGPDKNGRRPIHDAAIAGTLDCLHTLIEAGVDITASDIYGSTALHYAAQRGSLGHTALLLDAKCDINQPDKTGRVPLHLAAAHGHKQVVRELLKRGALVDGSDSSLETPLVTAMLHFRRDVCLELLGWTTRPNIELRDTRGYTPLFRAIMMGELPLVKALLSSGADRNATDGEGRHVLEAAAQTFNPDLTMILLGTRPGYDEDTLRKATKAAIDSRKVVNLVTILKHRREPLSWAELELMISTAELGVDRETSSLEALSQGDLISRAFSVDAPLARLLIAELDPATVVMGPGYEEILLSMIQLVNINGVRALLERHKPTTINSYRVLCVLGKMPPDMTGEMVDLLDSYHLIDYEQRDQQGWTTGHLLVRFGSLEAIQKMQARGHRFTQQTASGLSMLQIACFRDLNVPEVIDLLLDPRHKQDLAHVDENGWSVVHVASRSLSGPKALEKVVELGADVNTRALWPTSSTVLYIACSTPGSRVLKWAWDHLPPAVITEQLKAKVGAQQKTPLHAAVVQQSRELVEDMLKAGAAVDEPDAHGWTPLFDAIASRNEGTTKVLLAHGVGDIDHQDLRGRTALHLACGRGLVDVVKMLVRYGASPAVTDRENWTAEDVCRREMKDAVAALGESPEMKALVGWSKAIEHPTPAAWSSNDRAGEICVSEDGLEAWLPGMLWRSFPPLKDLRADLCSYCHASLCWSAWSLHSRR